MDPIRLLYETNILATMQNPVNYIEENIEECKLITSSEIFDNKWKTAYKNFKKENEIKGSVDVEPEAWARLCYTLIKGAKKESKTTVRLPNGCCIRDDCTINTFFRLFIKELSKE